MKWVLFVVYTSYNGQILKWEHDTISRKDCLEKSTKIYKQVNVGKVKLQCKEVKL